MQTKVNPPVSRHSGIAHRASTQKAISSDGFVLAKHEIKPNAENSGRNLANQIDVASSLGHNFSQITDSVVSPAIQLKTTQNTPIQKQEYGVEDENKLMSEWYDSSAGVSSPDVPMSIPTPAISSISATTSNASKYVGMSSPDAPMSVAASASSNKKGTSARKTKNKLNRDKSFSQHTGDFVDGVVAGGTDFFSGLGSMLGGGWDLTGGWLTNPEESQKTWQGLQSTTNAVVDDPSLVWEGIKAPYVEAVENGRPWEAVGRGTFDILSAVVGAKGIEKLTKGSKIAKGVNIVDKTSDATKVADKASDIAKIGRSKKSAKSYGNLSRAQLEKSKRRYQKRLVEHEKKLKEYSENPYAHDNKGTLRNNPKELHSKIIEGRKNALREQIEKHKGELAKIEKKLAEGGE